MTSPVVVLERDGWRVVQMQEDDGGCVLIVNAEGDARNVSMYRSGPLLALARRILELEGRLPEAGK